MIANVTSEWVDGVLVFKNAATGATLCSIDPTTGFIGAVAGAVTGNVTGNVTGAVSGGEVNPSVAYSPAQNVTAGDLLYISGWDATNGRFAMNKADADAADPAKVAEFVAAASALQGAAAVAVGRYTLTAQNTNAATVGDPVYLSTTAGGWSLSAPDGAGVNIQRIGVVSVKSATVGEIVLFPFYSKGRTDVS